MRISDWSSDVCSSDLDGGANDATSLLLHHALRARSPSQWLRHREDRRRPDDNLVKNDRALAGPKTVQRRRDGLPHLRQFLRGDAIGRHDVERVAERAEQDAAVAIEGDEARREVRSAEHTPELQSLMRQPYA